MFDVVEVVFDFCVVVVVFGVVIDCECDLCVLIFLLLVIDLLLFVLVLFLDLLFFVLVLVFVLLFLVFEFFVLEFLDFDDIVVVGGVCVVVGLG